MAENVRTGEGLRPDEPPMKNRPYDGQMDAGEPMDESFDFDNVDELLAMADELLEEINAELSEYTDDARRAEIEDQAARLDALRTQVRSKVDEKPEGVSQTSEGMHEAMDDIAKAVKSLAGYLS